MRAKAVLVLHRNLRVQSTCFISNAGRIAEATHSGGMAHTPASYSVIDRGIGGHCKLQFAGQAELTPGLNFVGVPAVAALRKLAVSQEYAGRRFMRRMSARRSSQRSASRCRNISREWTCMPRRTVLFRS